MDNLTHSLIGAIIGQTGLKRLSGLGMPTLIIAANIPDVDAACTIYGLESLAMRRGLTHGPIAMLILPLLLTGGMVMWDRWQLRRGKRPLERLPVRPLQLYLLALIGTLSHPAFDWLNNYGVRLLEPFSSRWFYGDSIFIIDIWMLVILICGLAWSRRREKRGGDWARLGKIAVVVLLAYITGNALLTRQVEQSAQAALAQAGTPTALVVASPPPILFWQRDIFWRTDAVHGSGTASLFGRLTIDTEGNFNGMDDPALAAAVRSSPNARAFLFWSRMPVVQREGNDLVLTDQRYSNPYVRDRFMVRVPVPTTLAQAAR